jgi:uronate dehydrogenase
MTHSPDTETWAITGAAGRIGTTLRAGLSGKVAGLVLIDRREVSDLRSGETAVLADLADPLALRDALDGVDGVIHLAAIADEADFHDLAEVNIVGTWHLLEAARQAGVTRVVYASTGRTIGMYDVSVTVTTEMATRPDGLYAVSKVAGEALCRLYADKFGFTATCLRIGAFKAAPLDDRDLSVWLSPEDAVAAVLAGMAQDGPSFNVVLAYSDNEHSWVDLRGGRELGYSPQDNASDHLRGTPITQGRQAGALGDASFTLDRQRPFR